MVRGRKRWLGRGSAMTEEVRHPDGQIEHPSVRYEPTDASLSWVLGTVLGAVILGGIIYSSVLAFYNHSRANLAEMRKSRFPLRAPQSWTLPPQPRLEQLERLK